MVVTCPNCGKLVAAEDSRCPNCGATREPMTQPVSSAWPGSSPTRAQDNVGQFWGCLSGGVLAIVVLYVFGAFIFWLATSRTSSIVIPVIAITLIAVALIPVLLPYGRRLSQFVRWMLGTTCILLLFGLGAFAACAAMFRSP